MAMLVFADSDGVERSFTVGPEPVLVGRANECTIRSSDPRVSRNHARFYLDATGQLCIEDLGSSNGVFIGPHRIQHSAVPYNEYVVVGSLVFRLVPEAPPPPPPIAPPSAWLAPETQPSAHAYPPAARPPAAEPPPPEPEMLPSSSIIIDESITDPVGAERKARLAAEEERDAYGARMAELHQELRALREQLGPREPAHEELEAARARVEELSEQLAAAEARARFAEEQLQVARGDLLASEERIVDLSRTIAELQDKLGGR